MTQVIVEVRSEEHGNIAVNLEPFTREIGDDERDIIKQLLEEALQKVSRAYQLNLPGPSPEDNLVKVTLIHPDGHEQEAFAPPGGHIKLDLREPSP
ncbi:hypothetical protein G9444_2508 [Rhodococcus erythropolis]|uniref:Uncharacterized protein n=1 Tax=Rhodococcus erythropolis TaxID=1833 RepID=A0A6G9CSC7_RHOER|nr:hypothetical protein [Rhodococcus erythropolis]QIP39752.1 hypothetical protein G9444_2508 [Rhodococcus erythropolis]